MLLSGQCAPVGSLSVYHVLNLGKSPEEPRVVDCCLCDDTMGRFSQKKRYGRLSSDVGESDPLKSVGAAQLKVTCFLICSGHIGCSLPVVGTCPLRYPYTRRPCRPVMWSLFPGRPWLLQGLCWSQFLCCCLPCCHFTLCLPALWVI